MARTGQDSSRYQVYFSSYNFLYKLQIASQNWKNMRGAIKPQEGRTTYIKIVNDNNRTAFSTNYRAVLNQTNRTFFKPNILLTTA
jgi:hypothetical protein